ncbi:hypothetical protein ACG-M12_0004 [Escherichia phage vB_EcoS_ACG-M12]|uniref:Uncharacterized protein n=2 Tax=Guelphvirus TaxID=2732062 RepID=K4FJD3_9CAUD|nr:hypothetical protein D861_gp75 [Escherichia phage vB_EcoS_ACG-M12]AFH19885.1 hypothetical protein ACG-M12_0004 [Escherichia phage vB_EcoS_ACG-M12]UOX39680.1 hypothetical protein [Escherichia phage vB_EcoS_SCS31]
MHTIQINDLISDALPWIIWSLGFMIVYIIASFADDAKEEIKE